MPHRARQPCRRRAHRLPDAVPARHPNRPHGRGGGTRAGGHPLAHRPRLGPAGRRPVWCGTVRHRGRHRPGHLAGTHHGHHRPAARPVGHPPRRPTRGPLPPAPPPPCASPRSSSTTPLSAATAAGGSSGAWPACMPRARPTAASSGGTTRGVDQRRSHRGRLGKLTYGLPDEVVVSKASVRADAFETGAVPGGIPTEEAVQGPRLHGRLPVHDAPRSVHARRPWRPARPHRVPSTPMSDRTERPMHCAAAQGLGGLRAGRHRARPR